MAHCDIKSYHLVCNSCQCRLRQFEVGDFGFAGDTHFRIQVTRMALRGRSGQLRIIVTDHYLLKLSDSLVLREREFFQVLE